jgi:hypothetical protein
VIFRSTIVDREPLSPTFVQEYLRQMVDIDISLEEAAAIIPNIEANRTALASLDKFDVQEIRPASVYNPAWRVGSRQESRARRWTSANTCEATTACNG